MSQIRTNITHHGYELQVVAGWDRPFNHYFANVYFRNDEDWDDDDPKEDRFYSTMDDPESDFGGGFASLDEVQSRVESRVGKLPAEFWEKSAIKEMNLNLSV